METRIVHRPFLRDTDYKWVTEWINEISLVRVYGEDTTRKGMSVNCVKEIGGLGIGLQKREGNWLHYT